MALRNATITFYRIEACGYYRRGDQSPVFGGTADTLQDMERWARGKHVSLTKLWELTEENDDQLPVYLFDMKRRGNDWLVATWNEVSATEKGVLSLAEESIVGVDAETHANGVVARTIPGFPAYFWFLPELDVMATVKLERTLSAKDAMAMYFLHFLRQESTYVVQDDEGNIQGYMDPFCTEQISGKPYPRFKLGTYAKTGEIDLIRRSREQIRKVVRSGTLRAANSVDSSVFGGLLAFFRGVHNQRRIVGEQKLRIELDFTPTEEELDRMIQIELSIDRTREWGGLGVVLQGEGGRVRWVSRSIARDTYEFNLRLNRSGVVLVDSLLECLHEHRGAILRILE